MKVNIYQVNHNVSVVIFRLCLRLQNLQYESHQARGSSFPSSSQTFTPLKAPKGLPKIPSFLSRCLLSPTSSIPPQARLIQLLTSQTTPKLLLCAKVKPSTFRLETAFPVTIGFVVSDQTYAECESVDEFLIYGLLLGSIVWCLIAGGRGWSWSWKWGFR